MIFNLFKAKPILKELIPQGFVDIHSHILPGIDDGAKDLNDSIEIINEMNQMGFLKIYGTPHTYTGVHDNDKKSIRESFEKLSNKINSKVNISYASEYMLDDTILEKIKEKEIICLKENYILVEMSYISPPINLYEIIFKLILGGYIPILAHPERYFFFHNDFNEYYKLKKVGCLFQANLLSSVDYYGSDVRKIMDKLLKNNMIDFVGSDTHNLNHLSNFNKEVKLKNIENLNQAISKTINKFKD